MTRVKGLSILGAVILVSLFGWVSGCGNDGASKQQQRGPLICQTTRAECVALFQGTYSGTYPSGTWTIYVAPDGTVQGTVKDANGNEYAVTGTVDETGFIVFGSTGTGTFQGGIDFDQVSGTWTGQGRSGSFEGSFVSREPPLREPDGGTPDGSTTPYCDRADVKAAECGIGNDECTEPMNPPEICVAECLLGLTCAELQSSAPNDCFDMCLPDDGTPDYCDAYMTKLEQCGTEDWLLFTDICLTTEPPADTCLVECVTKAECVALQDEQAVIDSCTSVCESP